MKKMLIVALCAVMTIGAFMTPAQAASQPGYQKNSDKALVADPRRGPGGPGRYPDRRPPPPRRDRDRYRRHHGGSGWVGLGIGAAIGTAIGAAIANSAPAPQPVMVYDPACNCYYYR